MNLRALKKELEFCFEQLKGKLEQNEFPELNTVKKFVQLTNQMQTMANESWAYEADDFLHLAKQLYQCAKNNKLNEMILLLTSLEDAKNFCHRTFK